MLVPIVGGMAGDTVGVTKSDFENGAGALNVVKTMTQQGVLSHFADT
jgi:hypothetical protein